MISTLGGPVYLAAGATDLRAGIDGLAVLVQERFQLDPFTGGLFVFCNKRQDRIKCLIWDKNGFWLMQKRLEKNKFKWPQQGKEPLKVSYSQFRWLLDGLSIEQNKAFKELKYNIII